MAEISLATLTAALEGAAHRGDSIDELAARDMAKLQRYVGTTRPMLMVKTDELRKLARATARTLPAGDEGDAAWLALLDALYSAPAFEQRLLAGHLLHARPTARRTLELARLRGWLGDLQGWCEVDTICQSGWSAAEVLARWNEWQPFLNALSRDEKMVLRRASLVLLKQPVVEAEDQRPADQAFANVERLMSERDPLIAKAVSWLLRELTRHHAPRVVDFLGEHARELPAVAVRETRRKLETGKK